MQKKIKGELHPILNIPLHKMPRHIAIIMDGNGRWAKTHGLLRIEGHRNGVKNVRSTITEVARLGIECLTLYCFSTENWKRPAKEIAGLMTLFERYLIHERSTIIENNIRLRHVGSEHNLPKNVLCELQKTIQLSKKNTGMTLCLAMNYSGRWELIEGIKKIVDDVQNAIITPKNIDETTVNSYLNTAGLPEPDLLIRTSGEMRLSNFLLWQIAYTELYVTDVFWPDFTCDILHNAIRIYAQHERRFGGLAEEAD